MNLFQPEQYGEAHQFSKLEEFPSLHLITDHFFPHEFYKSILQNLPDVSFFHPKIGGYEQRGVFSVETAEINQLAYDKKSFWLNFYDWLHKGALENYLVQAFRKQVIDRFVDAESIDLELSCVVCRDEKGYGIGPHTDTIGKIISGIIYLPMGNEKPPGTSIYQPKMPSLIQWNSPHFSPADFEKIKEVDFKENRLLAFAVGQNTFHGVEILDTPFPRYTLQLNLRYRNQGDEEYFRKKHNITNYLV